MSHTATMEREPRRQTNLVVGPDGFTESFSNDTVDLMLKLGLIESNGITSAAQWETRFYRCTQRPPMDIG